MQIEHAKDPREENNFVELKELAKHLDLNKTERKKFKRAAKELKDGGDFRFVEIDDEIYALKDADYSDFLEALKLLRK